MTNHNLINNLMINRFMRSETEIKLFEKALEEICRVKDYRMIENLIDVLDDETEHEEVMWGIIHTIEFLSKSSPKEALKIQINAIPDNIETCRDWIDIITFRILNNDEYRILFAEALKEVNTQVQEKIVSLLNEIKNEDPILFEAKVEEVKTILNK